MIPESINICSYTTHCTLRERTSWDLDYLSGKQTVISKGNNEFFLLLEAYPIVLCTIHYIYVWRRKIYFDVKHNEISLTISITCRPCMTFLGYAWQVDKVNSPVRLVVSYVMLCLERDIMQGQGSQSVSGNSIWHHAQTSRKNIYSKYFLKG